MKWVKRAAMIVFALLILGAIIYGFLPQPIPSEFARAVYGDLRATIDEEGHTRVKDRFTIYAPAYGSITRINLKAGDTVDVGTPITVLAPAVPPLLDARARAQAEAAVKSAESALQQAQANVAAAKAQHELSVKELDRARELRVGKHVSAEYVEIAEAREASAAAARASAGYGEQVALFQLQLAEAALIEGNGAGQGIVIASPVKGRVLRVQRVSEGPVQPGEMLLELGDPASLEIVVDLLSSEAVRVRQGMDVSIERWGGEPLMGRVRHIEPFGVTKISALGVEEQRVNVVIDFAKADHGLLGDGYRVEARIITHERKGALIIPGGALFETPEGTAVFVVSGGRAIKRVVSIGSRTGLEAEVLDHLSEGDTVIVHPGDDVTDGAQVIER